MDIRRRTQIGGIKKTSSGGDDIIPEPTINTDNYLTIEARENGLTASLSTNACEYCVDGDGNWKSLAAGTATETINTGHTLSFRGNLTPITAGANQGIGNFTISKKCNLKGNCMSMLFGDNAVNNYSLSDKRSAFVKLFYNCTNIVNVSSGFLPATTLAYNCYYFMFYDCTNLTTAPALPATTLTNYCYQYMFNGCKSLTAAPELPATTLTDYCYYYMFSNCTSLVNAPELPATTLAKRCYNNMFDNCSSLTTAPELPATTLATNCYNSMFVNCKSLTTAPALPATTLTNYCYQYMFYGCKSLTAAPELPATTLADWCYSYMFQNCSNLTTAPELPATTLAEYCYNEMFYNCTSLTTAPALPATTLTNYCYQYMFNGCSKLNYIKMLATDISAINCLYNWVGSVSRTGTFVKNPAMTSLPTGASGIPSGWTVVNDGEESLNLVIDYNNVTQNDVDQIINYMVDNGWTTDNKIYVQVINSNITVLYRNTEYPITQIGRDNINNCTILTLFPTDIGVYPYFSINEENLRISIDD